MHPDDEIFLVFGGNYSNPLAIIRISRQRTGVRLPQAGVHAKGNYSPKLDRSRCQNSLATAEYYPSLQLGGLAGLSATQAGHLLDSDAGLWAGGAIVQWRLLDWGRIDADVAAAKGRKAEALAAYRAIALDAAAEIDTALATLQTTAEHARRMDDFRQALARMSQIAARAHAVGETALPPVLGAQDRSYAAGDDLVQARAAALSASINLYRALGGA